MEQIEFENHIEKIKHRVEEGDYKTAAKIADKIDWENVEDINLLVYVAAIYDNINDYMSAKAILEYAYSIAPIKNRLYFALCSINIKMRELKAARDYFVDFCMSFPNDPRKHLLKYYFLKAKGADIDQQIRLLKDYTDEEKEEDMLYELALLYDKIENKEKVIETCNFIIDFFGVKINGYGKDALLLKKKWTELNEYEKNLLFDAEYNMRLKEPSSINYGLGEDDRVASIKKEEVVEKQETHRQLEDELQTKQEPIEKIKREDQVIEEKGENVVNIEEANKQTDPMVTYSPDEESYQPNKKEMAFLNVGEEEKKKKLRELIKKLKEEAKNEESKNKQEQDHSSEHVMSPQGEDENTSDINRAGEHMMSSQGEEENTSDINHTGECLRSPQGEDDEPKIRVAENIYEQHKEEEELKKELKKLYTEELGLKPYRKQSFELLRRFKNMTKDYKLHMIIEANSKEEAMDIAKSELKYIHRQLGDEKKAVKISAYNINDNGFDYYLQKLGNRDIVIESAGRLIDKVIDDIEEFILNKRNKNIVVLTDVINNFDKLVDRRQTFIERFDIYSVLSEKEKPKEERIIKETKNNDKDDHQDYDKSNLYKRYDDEAKGMKLMTREEYEKNKKENENNTENKWSEIENSLDESKKQILSEEEKEKLKQELREELKQEEKRREEQSSVKVVKNEDLIEKVMEQRKEAKKNPIKIKKDEMSEDDFVEFCKSYAKSIDCVLQGKTIPVLYECIEDMKEAGIDLTEENAINLIEDAADRAEKPKLFSKPKYDKEGCLILSEEHFL